MCVSVNVVEGSGRVCAMVFVVGVMLCLKAVFVGEGGIGKTSYLMRATDPNAPIHEYVPTVFDNYSTNIKLPNGDVVNLGLWDTGGTHTTVHSIYRILICVYVCVCVCVCVCVYRVWRVYSW